MLEDTSDRLNSQPARAGGSGAGRRRPRAQISVDTAGWPAQTFWATRTNYGGMWADEGGTPHLAIARGDNRIVMAAKSGLSKDPVMHEVAFTVDELTAMQDDLAAAARADGFRLEGATVSSIEQDIVNNQVIVYLVKPTKRRRTPRHLASSGASSPWKRRSRHRQRRATSTTARVR